MPIAAQLKSKIDKNLVFIWEELMSVKARSFAKQALLRVLIGSALLIVMPYTIGFLVDGLSDTKIDILLIGGALYFSIKLSGIGIGWLRQQVRERFFQEEFWYLPQAITAMYFMRPLAWLSGGTSEIDGGGVDSLRDKVWSVINSYFFQIIPGYAQVTFALRAIQYWLDNNKKNYIRPRDKNMWQPFVPVTKIEIVGLEGFTAKKIEEEEPYVSEEFMQTDERLLDEPLPDPIG